MRNSAAVLVLLAVVAAAPAHAEPSFGQPFLLGVGQATSLGNGEVSVGFTRVDSDSRCPVGVWCFWEGDAAVRLWLYTPGSVSQEFVLHTFAEYQTALELGRYLVSLQGVAPYPLAGVVTDPATYFVELVVTRAATDVESRAWGRVKALYR